MKMYEILRDVRKKNPVLFSFYDFFFNKKAGHRNSLQPDAETVRRMQALYGKNRKISGTYNKNLSAECANGIFVGKDTDGVLAFKGIPFAKPPVGSLRWKRPERPEDSTIVREAYHFGPSPIQSAAFSERASSYVQSEDCLYLNIWTCPDGGTKKAVMFFIHGGSYGWGGTSDPLYEGHNFVKAHPDIVLVTVAYRTGIMGFMDFSSVPGGGAYYDACNLGLFDQIRGLEWVKENIASFGGDPDNVTIFGESAGGGSVSLLPIMPEAKGLFRRVIAESGSICLTFSKDEAQLMTKKLMKSSGCKTMDELLALSEKEIMDLNEPLNVFNNFPVRDGKILPLDPYLSYKNGEASHVEMLIGTNADESRYWIREVGGERIYRLTTPVMFENNLKAVTEEDAVLVESFMKLQQIPYTWAISEFYNEMLFRIPAIAQAEAISKTGGKVYNYYWIYPSAIGNLGACHAVELAYVFNNLDETIYTGDNIDPALAKRVQNMWVNFAKTGDPSIEGFHWKPYNKKTRETAVLGKKDSVVKDLLKGQRILLQPLLKYFFNGTYVNLSLNVPYVRGIAGLLLMVLLALAAIVILIVKLVQ